MGKAKVLSDEALERLVEALPLGEWTQPNLRTLAEAFGVDYTQGSAALRRALRLEAVRSHGAVRVDWWRDHIIGRAYVLGYEGEATRIHWLRAAPGSTVAEVLASARHQFGIATLEGPAAAVQPAPAAPQQQPLRLVPVEDDDLARALRDAEAAVAADRRTLAVSEARLLEVRARWVARVEHHRAALRRLGVEEAQGATG